MNVIDVPQTPDNSPRKRSKSSVLKSFVLPRRQSPSPTKSSVLREILNDQNSEFRKPLVFETGPLILPADHPHANQLLSGKPEPIGQGSPSPKKIFRQAITASPIPPGVDREQIDCETSPGKRKLGLIDPKDKENTSPDTGGSPSVRTPIWSRYANQTREPITETSPTPKARPAGETPKATFHPNPQSWFDNQKSNNVEAHTDASPSHVVPDVRRENCRLTWDRSSPVKQALQNHTELDAALEAILDARNVSENLRQNMRGLDAKIKKDLIRHGQAERKNLCEKDQVNASATSLIKMKSLEENRGRSTRNSAEGNDSSSRSKRSSSRGRLFTLGKSDCSPSKKPRSISRPRSIISLRNLSSKNLSSVSVHSFGLDGSKESREQPSITGVLVTSTTLATPDDFVRYLRSTSTPQNVEVGKLHKLRLLTRNESLSWINSFLVQGGIEELLKLLDRIMKITWREEHEDILLHEILQCLKGLSTTQPGLDKVSEASSTLFPNLLKMLFDDERRGPSEYNTRGIVISLMFHHLAAAGTTQLSRRAQILLGYLSDPDPDEEHTLLPFVSEMRWRRPYKVWCKEISNVTKEVFWIFLHQNNIIPGIQIDMANDQPYAKVHFPRNRLPIAAAPYVGGVEWEAANYLADHIDLMNGLIAAQPDAGSRNVLREQLRASGFEKLMGKTLRTCKEKFHVALHDGLRTWVTAAIEDDWPTRDVQVGPPMDENQSPRKHNGRKEDIPPKIDLPNLDFRSENHEVASNIGWAM